MDTLSIVNRSAIAVYPKKPFLDWLRHMAEPIKVTLVELQQGSNLYLVPECEEEAGIRKAVEVYLESNYQDIVFNELAGWYLDARLYPKLSYAAFLPWFEIHVYPMIFDTVTPSLGEV